VRSKLKTTYIAGSQPPNIQVLSDSEGEIPPPMDKDTYDTILFLSYLALFFPVHFTKGLFMSTASSFVVREKKPMEIPL
jgi:hypothetical protein